MSLVLNGTDGLSDVDGSAATPAIRGTDANTGIFFPAADTIAFAEGGAEVMRIDSSGNVGIGTSSPATTLQARKDSAGGTTYAIYTDNGAAGAGTNIAGIGFVNAGSMKSSITAAVYGNDYMAFNVGGSGTTERARIDSSGNLLVGTTSGLGKLTLEASPGNLTTPNFSSRNNSSVGGSYALHFNVLNSSGSQVGYISANGTATFYATSSDYRLKNTIAPMTGALAKVIALKPCTYKWNSDGSEGEGFIAHELGEVCPNAVAGEKDAVDADGNPVYQGIDTSFLVATLTAAIQEQQAIITAQAAQIQQLREKVFEVEEGTSNMLVEVTNNLYETITALTARVAALEGTQP